MQMRLWILLIIMLIGCRPTGETITPIAKLPTTVSVTSDPTSTLAPTRIIVATDAPTIESATPSTPTAAPTSPPQPTTAATTTSIATIEPSPSSTASPTIIAPTPTEASASEPVVNYFRFAAPLTKPSEPTLLEWDVQGVSNVVISRNGGEWAEAGQQWNVANRDTMSHTFPPSVGGWPVTYMLTSPDAPLLYAEFTVTVPCQYEWLFPFDYPGATCPTEPLVSAAAFQSFEEGFMLWTQELDQILYSNWDGTIHGEVTDMFDVATDPIRLDWVEPPTNYLQPEYGFGKLWRENDFVRQTLGWAVDRPIDFSSIRQAEPNSRYGDFQSYIGLPEEGVIAVNEPSPNWTITYPTPDIPAASERPPLTFTPPATPTAVSGEVVVNYFHFTTEPTKPTDALLLEWDVVGVETIEVRRNGGEWGEAQATYELPAQGTLEQSFIPALGGWPIYYIVNACSASECIEHVYTVELPCEYPVVIPLVTDQQACLDEGIISNGFQQNFENGFMIWIEAQDVIIYSSWDGTTHAELVDTFEHGVDPVRDESIAPPTGFYQPEYGIGKVWREEAGVRELLGWATDWGAAYTVKRQSQPPHRYGYREWITMKDDRLIIINHPNPTWTIE